MIFRRASLGDTAELRRMMAESNGYPDGPQREMIRRYAADWRVDALPEGPVWVLADDAGAAGFHRLIPCTGRELELDLFFTANDRQGRGLGRLLFAHMAEQARARGATRVLIVSNPQAADFYRRMGATDAGMSEAGVNITWRRPRLVLELG